MGDSLERVRVTRYLTMEDAAAFHGHMGPFLVIGYRAGRYAVKVLRPRDEFDLSTTVYIPLKTPFSCILDGIQCATKCTLGKWNIKWVESNEFKIEFLRKSTGKKLVLKVKPEIIEEALNCLDIREMVRKLTMIEIEDIAEVTS